MRLLMGNGQVIREPDDKTIKDAIHSLRGNYGEEPGFAILDLERTEGDGNFFMQTAGGPDTFIVEYRDGIKKRQYYSKNEKLEQRTVILLFQAYGRGDESWKCKVSWRDMAGRELKTGGRELNTRITLYIVIWTAAMITVMVTVGFWWGMLVCLMFFVLIFFLRGFLGLPRK
ncbi:hypothetical protein ES703_123391 [subsurface metagenome]